ncbi:MAG: ABC transporter permease [Bacteroidetes bacterium]|nr:ABC transporter permease [Bacteroidota bacterium]
MLAVALSVAVMMVSVAVVVGFKQEINEKITGFTGDVQIARFSDENTFESHPIEKSDSLSSVLLDFPFVEKVQPYAIKAAILKSSSEWEGVVLKGVENNFSFNFLEKQLVSGRLPDFNADKREALISEKQANKLGLKVDEDAILFFVQDPPVQLKIKVVGIYNTELEEIDDRFMLGNISLIQNVNEWDSSIIGGYQVDLIDNDLELLLARTNEIRYAINIHLNARSVTERYPQIFDWLELLNMNILIIMVLMIGVAVVNMVTVILILILEKTQMVGILKSIGMNAISLRKVFVYNGGWFVLTGLILGNLVGIGAMLFESHFQLISISPDTYYISKVPIAFTWGYWLLINVGTLLICLLTMVLPAYMVGRIKPVKALRFS